MNFTLCVLLVYNNKRSVRKYFALRAVENECATMRNIIGNANDVSDSAA